jgi:dolichyl-phosphate-mannose-protein mannosyltransferase
VLQFRRWFCATLAVGRRPSTRTKILVALLIFLLSFSIRSLFAGDLAPVMYTSQEPLGSLADIYDARATSILSGQGLLGPYYDDVHNTSPLARAPGYPIFLSFIYSTLGRDYFKVQLVQNALNSLSSVLIFLIGGLLISWRVGIASGLLAALSHHLSYMSNWILPDSIVPLFLLLAVYLIVISKRLRKHSCWLFGAAGIMIGLAAWLRSLTMLLGPFFIPIFALTSTKLWPAVKRATVMTACSLLMIAPITIKNYLCYREFVPINIQMGLVMWVGIADASGDRFGAVQDDNEVAEQEAVIYGNPRYARDWSSPDGIRRDRNRVKKCLDIILKHPVWYSGVMLDRMGEMLKYSAHAPLIYKQGPKDFHAVDEIRPQWQFAGRGESSLRISTALGWMRMPTRVLQRITKESLLIFILLGAAMVFGASWRRGVFLLVVPLYHLLSQSLMHTEFRYGLAIHYFLFVFAGTVWVMIVTSLPVAARAVRRMIMRFKEPEMKGRG